MSFADARRWIMCGLGSVHGIHPWQSDTERGNDGTTKDKPQDWMVTGPLRLRYARAGATRSCSPGHACVGDWGGLGANPVRGGKLGRDRLRPALRSALEGALGQAGDDSLRRLRVRPGRRPPGPVLRPPQPPGARRSNGHRDHRLAAIPSRRKGRLGVEPRPRPAVGDAERGSQFGRDAGRIARPRRPPNRRPLRSWRRRHRDRLGGRGLRWQKRPIVTR